MIVMDAKTQLKVDIIGKMLQGKIATKDASRPLGRSVRTIERYAAAYREKGILFAKHGNAGRRPLNKTPSEAKEAIQGRNLLRKRIKLQN